MMPPFFEHSATPDSPAGSRKNIQVARFFRVLLGQAVFTHFCMYFSIPQKSVGTRFNWYR